jgi:alpha-glucosidase (family GH31 glycosyl hydrolase)
VHTVVIAHIAVRRIGQMYPCCLHALQMAAAEERNKTLQLQIIGRSCNLGAQQYMPNVGMEWTGDAGLQASALLLDLKVSSHSDLLWNR